MHLTPVLKRRQKKAMLLVGFLGMLFTGVKDLQGVLSLKVIAVL